jgi:type I restriction enzyme M protein
MIKGNDPENIRVGSTLSTDEFAGESFDFMLSNPPYGKSWGTEAKYIKDGKDIIDPRFEVELTDYWGNLETCDATPRSSDGQLLFLMEMVNKMKGLDQSPRGSRIASVHNGSSLFTGDAGGGESNIRRYIIENDLLSAIIQLPNNMFYNTGITTYIWLLSNNKTAQQKGKVQLIDASQRFTKLRKNLGNKNCEFQPTHIQEIMDAYFKYETIDRSQDDDLVAKVFDNNDFGYYKVAIERPKRLKAQFSQERINELRFDKTLLEPMQWAFEEFGNKVYSDLSLLEPKIMKWCEEQDLELNTKKKKTLFSEDNWKKYLDIYEAAAVLLKVMGGKEFTNFNQFQEEVAKIIKDKKLKISGSPLNQILSAVSWYDETADKVVKKTQKLSGTKLSELLAHLNCTTEQLSHYGYFPSAKKDEYTIYETESDLRDFENIPLKDNIHSYFLREVLPHVEEAWIDMDKTKIGYEISFNKYFYQHKPLRSLEEVSAEILALERENDGLIMDILNFK